MATAASRCDGLVLQHLKPVADGLYLFYVSNLTLGNGFKGTGMKHAHHASKRWLAAWLALLCLASCGLAQAAQSLPFTLMPAFTQLTPLVLAPADQQWLQRHGVLRVGVSITDHEPVDITVDRNRYRGISADYLNLIAGRLGAPLQIQGFARREEAVEALQNREIDILTGASGFERQVPGLAFTRAYMPDDAVLVVRDTGAEAALPAGGKIAVLDGYTDLAVLHDAYPGHQIVVAPSLASGLEAVAQGDVQGFVGNEVVVRAYSALRPFMGLRIADSGRLPAAGFAFAVRRGDGPLQAMLDRALGSIEEPLRREILGRWTAGLGSDIAQPRVQLSAEEAQWRQAHPKVRVIASEYPPYLYRDRQGNWVGLNRDVLATVSSMTGLQFEFIPSGSIAQNLQALRNGTADMSTTLSESPERKVFLGFSHSFGGQGWVFVVRGNGPGVASLDDMAGRVLALPREHALESQLRQQYPRIRLRLVDTYDQARDLVRKGEADATLDSEVSAWRSVARYPQGELRVGRSVEGGWAADHFAVRLAEPYLLSILNKSLEAYPVAELRAVRIKWLGAVDGQAPVWQRIAPWVWWALAAALSFGLVSLMWSSRLKAQIHQRERLEAELVKAREVAEQASQAKSGFLATMSHEIRTPMAAIIGLLELERETTRLRGGEPSRAVDVAYQSARDLIALIGDSLDLAKIESGSLQLLPEAVELRPFFEAIVQLFAAQASQRRLVLELTLAPEADGVYRFDPLRLRQVMHNLLSNALKFTARGGVYIDVQGRPGSPLQVSVRDTGVGIDSEQQGRLFKPFVQVGGQPDGQGTGLGLSICKQLVSLMDGQIQLSSVVGEGTCVVLRLPLPRVAAKPGTVVDAPPDVPTRALRVLVVDDLSANRLVVGQQVAFFGHAVHTASSGEEALAWWREHPVDVIITDCRMPGMSGYALTQAIRRAEAEAGRLPVPIFGCSANGQAEEAERCREAGMNQLLVKPLELQALGRLLASLGVPPAFDMDTLRRMTQADAEVMRRMLEELQRNIAQELEGLASAVSKADWPALRAALHRLKGVACLIDAAPMAKACAALDVSAREQRAQALEDEWAALHARLDELAEDIERQLWEMSYPK